MSISEKNIYNKLIEISNCLSYKCNELPRISIKYGKSGIALFYFMYYKFTGNQKYYNIGEQLLESIFNQINAGFSDGLIAEQYSDFGRLLELLNKTGLYNISTNEMLSSIDELETIHFQTCKSTKDYDVTCGALCAGYYFISRLNSKPDLKEKLVKITLWLEKISIEENEEAVYWESKLFNDNRVYFGATHGSASIIIFLAKMYNIGIAKEFVIKLIRKALNYILSHKKDIKKSNCFFPIVINLPSGKRPPPETRILLEWCYGDLGILYSLLIAATILKDKALYKQTIDMLSYYVKSKNENDAVIDAGIAHGASGTHYLFHKFYQLTNDPIFKLNSRYWINETFKYFNDFNSPNSLFYKSKYEVDIYPASNIGFMSGLAGIGIQYMIYLNNEMDIIDELLYM